MFISCTDNFDESKFYLGKDAYYLNCPYKSIFFNSLGGDTTIFINSASSWNVSCNESWLKVSPMNGHGSRNISINVQANRDIKELIGAINISLSDKKDVCHTVTVSQGTFAVDLGLSVYWASCNVGAYSPDSLGYIGLSKNEAESAWGKRWRLPTLKECQELLEICHWDPNGNYRVDGHTISHGGNSIYLRKLNREFRCRYHINDELGSANYFYPSKGVSQFADKSDSKYDLILTRLVADK